MVYTRAPRFYCFVSVTSAIKLNLRSKVFLVPKSGQFFDPSYTFNWLTLNLRNIRSLIRATPKAVKFTIWIIFGTKNALTCISGCYSPLHFTHQDFYANQVNLCSGLYTLHSNATRTIRFSTMEYVFVDIHTVQTN